MLVLASILPMLAFAGLLLFQLATAAQESIGTRVQDAARSTALIVDQELARSQALLTGLAASPLLDRRDFNLFYRQAERAVPERGRWIILFDANRNQILNTARPFGTTLPTGVRAPAVDDVLRTSKPAVTDLLNGSVVGGPIVGTAVPVSRNGEISYVLSMTFGVDAFSRLLAAQSIPTDWTVAILDRTGRVVARNRAPERYVGQQAVPKLVAQAATADEGTLHVDTLDNQRVYAAFKRSQIAGWTVAIGVPEASIVRPLRHSIEFLLTGGMVLFLTGVVLAIVMARRIATPVSNLASAALALGRGENSRLESTGIKEVDNVATALNEASRLLRERALERHKADTEIGEAHKRTLEILESITDAFYALDSDWRFTYVNRRALELLGKQPEEVLGRTLLEVLPQTAGSEAFACQRRVLAERQPLRIETMSPVLNRWVSLHVYPTEGGGLSVYFRDIQERKQAEERQTLLLNELNHRVKNTLAAVQSIALQTGRGVSKTDDFRTAFSGRILALARAHDTLTRSAWQGASLAEMAMEVLAPFGASEGKRVSVNGPDVKLAPNAGVTLGMAFYELAINAAKYGALSTPDGRAELSWDVVRGPDGGSLIIVWRETGGPAVVPPTRRGFGSRLIQRGLATELGGDIELVFPPTGVVCTIRLSLSQKVIAQ